MKCDVRKTFVIKLVYRVFNQTCFIYCLMHPRSSHFLREWPTATGGRGGPTLRLRVSSLSQCSLLLRQRRQPLVPVLQCCRKLLASARLLQYRLLGGHRRVCAPSRPRHDQRPGVAQLRIIDGSRIIIRESPIKHFRFEKKICERVSCYNELSYSNYRHLVSGICLYEKIINCNKIIATWELK
jgi:hypothetical protein